MKKYVFLNWKCNPLDWKGVLSLMSPLKQNAFLNKHQVVICAPFVFLENIKKDFKVETCGQNCFWVSGAGPYTGEISPLMLRGVGCSYVLVGHSERKRLFNETEKIITEKLKAALKAGLKPLLFFGETKKDSDKEMISRLDSVLKSIDKKDLQKILFVYEPVFAISTQGGKILPITRIKEKLILIRDFLKKKYASSAPCIIYGGSVNDVNLKQYLDQKEINGVVIGQASLSPAKMEKALMVGKDHGFIFRKRFL
ncbi:triose-phosphate isomerase [Candidatus Parcubacteria bacterium]|nr:triose-phosphate isomerase [Patescibacteria group bacterium]MBU4466957.1 triose-phosphate isomerase [Patescibacteria group bacterium]MCG2688229.1 triose-phosphate isomerase [Candidatus Parcubacteria bacterium]